jgi:hypothetical protein
MFHFGWKLIYGSSLSGLGIANKYHFELLGFGHCPSSGLLKTRKRNVLGTGSAIIEVNNF